MLLANTSEDLSKEYKAGYIDFWGVDVEHKFLTILIHKNEIKGYMRMYDLESMINTKLEPREIKVEDKEGYLKDKKIEKI